MHIFNHNSTNDWNKSD